MLSNCLSDTRWAPTIVLQYAPAHEATPPPTKPLSALCLRVEVCRDSWDCIQKLPVCGAARGWWVSDRVGAPQTIQICKQVSQVRWPSTK